MEIWTMHAGVVQFMPSSHWKRTGEKGWNVFHKVIVYDIRQTLTETTGSSKLHTQHKQRPTKFVKEISTSWSSEFKVWYTVPFLLQPVLPVVGTCPPLMGYRWTQKYQVHTAQRKEARFRLKSRQLQDCAKSGNFLQYTKDVPFLSFADSKHHSCLAVDQECQSRGHQLL